MKTLLKIAWRNIWRNRTRSLVVVISLAIGIWATVIILAVSDTLHIESLKDAIEHKYGHVQIENPDFVKNEKLVTTISNGERILEEIRTDEEVKAATARTQVYGIIASAGYSSNIVLIGVLPGAEEKTTMLKSRLSSGDYLAPEVRNPIILGEKLAKKLNIKPGNKVVLGFEGKEGTLISSTFRVTGLYNATQARDEEMLVYADLADVTRLAGIEGQYNKIVIKLNDPDQLAPYLASLKARFSGPDVQIRDWREANADLELLSNWIDQMDFIVTIIVLIALAFGILNTMLMSILERYKELGILMAIGMNRLRVFTMIVMETAYLSILGGAVGMGIGFITVSALNYKGISLSLFSEGLAGWGFTNIVYPTLEPRVYIIITVLVILTAVITSIYPAIKALMLKPNEAISKQN
ncbi:ABC-type lipoprotein release transport system permease subunit [Gillisia sp. Hel_I_86]|uniref:ABC transporter permease n=1 Tax=Gillisia sp. Hel_I_86 TaxID=1249981 RepID=UPI00119B5F37|nr:FtsX-like permease family protein [Gillisia sp. Hel_I_86]TVZ28674.1 ABC-type lipoprotein release transport system permease subunit [Gillisia sp. Hel_I_86]